MQVQQLKINNFIKTASSLVIPVYQRDYAWKIHNCEKLRLDIKLLIEDNKNSHFLGTIVTINSGVGQYLVIDGQQRLTTIEILLLALNNFLKKKDNSNDREIQLQNILNGYLIDEESANQGSRIKLKPNKSDAEDFEKLFNHEDIIKNNSNITNNYIYFMSKFEESEFEPWDIFEKGLKKLDIVSINLDRISDDPQLIFESLNSTGVDLTSGDLIRNYILMDLDPIEQGKQYNGYWIKIEKGSNDVAEFIRNYLMFKIKTSIKKDDVYEVFKKFSIDNYNSKKDEVLKDLLKYSNIYSYFVQNFQHKNHELNQELIKLNNIEFTVCYPYLFDVFSDIEYKVLTEDDAIKILKLIQSYAFRRILVYSTTQGLNKMFITLSKEIKKENNWEDQYINILNFILINKGGSQKFPNDEDFEKSLITNEVYKLQSKNKKFLLESLENYGNGYSVNLDNLTIEHIMPQTLTQEWKIKIGDNRKEIHSKYLHTIGNLTLTSKNSSLSNNTFEEKQKIDLHDSKLKLNFKLNYISTWSELEIIDRAKNLIKDAKKIWEFPKSNFYKEINEEIIYDLTSDEDFSSTKPFILYIGGKSIETKTRKDILSNTLRFLYNYSPTEFNKIENLKNFEWNFGKNRKFRNPINYYEGKIVEGNLSSNSIISFLNKICEVIKYDAEKIQFKIRDI